MSTSTEQNKNNKDQQKEWDQNNPQGKTQFKEEPSKDLDRKNKDQSKDKDESQDKNKGKQDQNKTESKGLFSKIGDVFSNVYEKTKEIILPDLGHKEEEVEQNQQKQQDRDKDKEKDQQKQDQDKYKNQNLQDLNKDNLRQKDQDKYKDLNQQDQNKDNLRQQDQDQYKLRDQKQQQKQDQDKDKSGVSQITSQFDKQHLSEKPENIPDIKTQTQEQDKENINMNVISGANIPQPDMTGSTKYYVQTLSGHDSSSFDETKRTLPTPNMN
jgi:hypothetical protein